MENIIDLKKSQKPLQKSSFSSELLCFERRGRKNTRIIRFEYTMKNKNNYYNKRSIFITEDNRDSLNFSDGILSRQPIFVSKKIRDGKTLDIQNYVYDDAIKIFINELWKSLKTECLKKRKCIPKKRLISKKPNRAKQLIFKQNTFRKAVEMVKNGFSYKYICDILIIKPNALKKAVFNAKKSLVYPKKKGRKAKISYKYINFISKYLEKKKNVIYDCFATKIQKDINAHFSELQDSPLSLDVVKKMIGLAGYSWKKTSQLLSVVNKPDQISKRFQVAANIIYCLKEKKEFIYIDETGFNKGLVPLYSYSKRGKEGSIFKQPKGKNFSIMCAISNRGLLAIQIFNYAPKGEDFYCFFLELIEKISFLGYSLPNTVFFMDNCSIHKKKEGKKLYDFINVLFNAPYSPFLNPIENYFGIVKKTFRSRQIKTPDNFFMNIVESFFSIEKCKIENCVRRALKFTSKAYSSEEID